MRKAAAQIFGIPGRLVMRVTTLGVLATNWRPELNFLVPIFHADEFQQLTQLLAAGIENVYPLLRPGAHYSAFGAGIRLISPDIPEVGDVVISHSERQEIQIAYRANDYHHSVFLTNRCNSYCLMCSQPPTRHNDDWLVDEAIQILRHIASSPRVLGITGGEPTLLGIRLREVLDTSLAYHPETRIDLLSNGRLLADPKLADALLSGLSDSISWLVPLYGHCDYLHDFVVQRHGAFEQTLEGLLNLQAYGQAIQLRIVLIAPVLQILPQFCSFIARNLPFVREVALMGCEPIGFALANRALCEVNLGDWQDTLIQATQILQRSGVPCLLMNTPLCTIPRPLWPLAQRSISDWKQLHLDECAGCAVMQQCSGLFAWQDKGWRPGTITRIQKETLQ